MRPCLRKQPQINTSSFFIPVLHRDGVLPTEQVCLLGLIKVQRVWLLVLSDPNIQKLSPPHAPVLYKEHANSSDLSAPAHGDERQGAEIAFHRILPRLARLRVCFQVINFTFSQGRTNIDCNRRCVNKAGLKNNIASCPHSSLKQIQRI